MKRFYLEEKKNAILPRVALGSDTLDLLAVWQKRIHHGPDPEVRTAGVRQ